MKTMKTYYIPETEIVDLHGEVPMCIDSMSDGGTAIPGSTDAPGRHLGGSLGPSY